MSDHQTEPPQRRGLAQGPLALGFGIAAACGVFFVRPHVAGPDDTLTRYLNDPLEFVLLAMFCTGLAHVLLRLRAGATRLANLDRIEGDLRQSDDPAVWRDLADSSSDPVVAGQLDSLADLRDRWTGGSVVDYAKLFAARAADEIAGGYAVLQTILWAIPIVGFLGTVLGITSAIASITPEQLEGSLVEVTGNLAFAFDTTGLSLGFSLVLGFAMLLARRREDRSLVRLEQMTELWLLPSFPETAADPIGDRAIRDALAAWSDEMTRHREQLGQTLGQISEAATARFETESAALRDASLTRQADGWTSSTEAIGQSVHAWGERVEAVLAESGDRFADGLRLCTGEANQTLAVASEQQRRWAELIEATERLETLQRSVDSQLQRAAFAEQLDTTLHQLTAAVHMLTTRAKAA